MKKQLVALALVLAGGASMAADQTADLSSGSAAFVGTPSVLAGGDDVISFVGLANGTVYDFLLSISSQNITGLGATLNGQAAQTAGFGKFRFAGLESSATAPFTLTITGTAGAGAAYSGQIAVTAVPEPETYAMLMAGLGAVGFMMRRRNKA